MSTLKQHEALVGGDEAAGTASAAGLQPTPRGVRLLQSPLLNKGTAFTQTERRAFGLDGLLPPVVETLDQQSHRAYAALRAYGTDLGRHIYLRALQDTNEILFYRLLPPRPHRRDAADPVHTDRRAGVPAVQPHLPAEARAVRLLSTPGRHPHAAAEPPQSGGGRHRCHGRGADPRHRRSRRRRHGHPNRQALAVHPGGGGSTRRERCLSSWTSAPTTRNGGTTPSTSVGAMSG